VIAKTCPRLWEVEAAHVGRLDRMAWARQREHQRTCSECGRLARSLTDLKEALAELVPPSDELSLRRLRQATLQRATAEQHKRPTRFVVRLRPRAIVTALVLAASAWGAWIAAHSSRAPLVEVTSRVEPSTWSRHHSPKLERVVLREGVFSLNVRRNPRDPRVVVEIPEGEIEDVGTTFAVTVHDGQTTRIAVTQGAVLLRRTGLPALKLLAGSVWQPVPQPEVLPPTAAHVPETTPAAPETTPAPHVHRSVTRRLQPSAAVVPPPPSAASTPADEDACYLEFVQLVHEQQREEAARVGRDYLQRFPSGFRRPDVERALLGLN